MLERTVHPNTEIEDYHRVLDAMAERVRELHVEGTSSLEVCKILNRVIFMNLNFGGKKEDFYNPDNSFLVRF